ncbi:MAG: glycosyltransferase [Muribaculaceae bacterium]|nr:glycosyltransferase [Muribaculaceae bacterium]
MISIVIPLYNKEKQIAETLQSVAAQTITDYEVVVVDDGSTDRSAEIVENHAKSDPRIRLIHQSNAGVSAARNRGIEEARGEFIALLDADDQWDSDYLETQQSLREKYPECRVFATNYRLLDGNGHIKDTIITNIKFDNTGILDNYFQVASGSNCPVWTSAVMIRRDALLSIGGFPKGIKAGEDLLTWARLACRYKIAYSIKPAATYRQDSGADNSEKPRRTPQEPDIVGIELKKLAKEYNTPYIRNYISLWHKMRSMIYARLGQNRYAIREALKAVRYSPTTIKNYAVLAYSILPRSISKKL